MPIIRTLKGGQKAVGAAGVISRIGRRSRGIWSRGIYWKAM